MALLSDSPTASCNQSIDFAIATETKSIASLKALKPQEPELLSGVDSEDKLKLLNALAAKNVQKLFLHRNLLTKTGKILVLLPKTNIKFWRTV